MQLDSVRELKATLARSVLEPMALSVVALSPADKRDGFSARFGHVE